MRCPVCAVDLKIADRQGIEIDYCPQCRGVWLDRGELDKLIERATPANPAMAYQNQPNADQSYQYQQPPIHNNNQYYDDDDDHHKPGYNSNSYNQPYPQNGQYQRKKREGFLGDLFDFD